jgi:hypothetical protein
MSDEDEIETKVSRVQSKEPKSSVGWVVPLFAVISLAALGLAGWAAFRPAPSDTPTYSDSQRADAKKKVCAAFATVRAGVNLNTNLQPAGGPEDITGALAVAANGRISLYDGGQYLLDRLDPATSSDLADSVRKFANNLMDIGAGATAGLQNSDPAQAALLTSASATDATVTGLCK